MAAHEKLAPIHSAILIYMIQSGVMVFVLPQRLAQTFGTNGWIAVAGFGLIVTLNIALIGLVYKLGGGRTIFEILEQSIPKPILFPFYAAIAVIWMMLGSMAGKEYILIFQMFSFPTTHSMLFYFALVTLVAWLLTKGIYNIAKAATLFFGMFIWMIFLLFFFWGEFEWGRLTPFLFKGGEFSLSEQFDMYSSFLGFELCLLLFGYVDRQTKLIGGAIWANGILTWNYLYAALMAFGIYSLQQLKSKMFPIIDILAYVRLPFIERVDNLFFGFFIFPVLFSVLMFVWAAGEMVGRIVPRMKKQAVSVVLTYVSYGLAFIPEGIEEVGDWLEVLSVVETGIALCLPLVLLVVLLAQRSGEGAAHDPPK